MDFDAARTRMIDEQLTGRGINDPRVLAAFRRVPRHAFAPEAHRESAYDDHPLPIGANQTISQPYMVALMTQCLALRGGERILEVGTGSGYQTAILAEIVSAVYSVERIAHLAEAARDRLAALGYTQCHITVADGTLGWQEHAPYDGIIVTAGAPQIPDTLTAQLADGGRLVIPVGGRWEQTLTVIEKTGTTMRSSAVCGCVFVPLVGKDGWA